jgi:hypothetical protein
MSRRGAMVRERGREGMTHIGIKTYDPLGIAK